MNTEQGKILNRYIYTLVSVEKAEPYPTWLPEGNWHRYVIGQGNSKLEGYKIGSIEDITEYAETVAEELNERSMKGKSPYAANPKKTQISAPSKPT